jgi:TRAP-type mannitol/chloroaromatic compound transport system permease small subunit
MRRLNRILSTIDQINENTGRVTSYLIFYMAFTITYEVILRYLFNSPTLWSMESNQYILCIYSALAGGYALLHKAHVNVDIISVLLPVRVRAAVNILTFFFFFIFALVLIWKSGVMAWDSLVGSEVSPTILEVPLFPVKVFIPLGGVLLLLQGIRNLITNIRVLASGVEDAPEAPSGKEA